MGDITSGGVQDDAAANMDFGGGGGSSSDSSNYSYSDLGQSPGAMGGVTFGGVTRPGEISPTSVPTVSPPMSPFQLGFGGAQKVPNYMDDLNTLMGGGGSSADASAVSVSDQPSPVPGVPDFIAFGGGTSAPDTKPQPVPGVPDFVAIGGGTSMSPGAVPFSGTPPPTPSVIDQQPKVDANELAKYYEGLIAGKGSPKNEQEKTFLSRIIDFLKNPGSTILGFIQGVLQGDPNFTGPSPAQQDLMGVPGPSPEVGGGVPSPSGTGGGTGGGTSTDMPVTTMPETPAETVIKADPCPPGFKLDPVLNQCMPIVKSAPTPPPMPTLPKPTAPTGGGIANVYPFTLTPPVGAPVGTVAPIRFTPK